MQLASVKNHPDHGRVKTHLTPPKRTAPFRVEPGYYEPAKLWLYGNASLLKSNLACVDRCFGKPIHAPDELERISTDAMNLVLDSKVLVAGIHNIAHQRAAVVPLRWGAPRILALSGGFYCHLGMDLINEPFRAARLWRHRFDPETDLVISLRAPDRLPTFSRHNPTVDRLIQKVVEHDLPGCLFGNPEF
jgi:DNA processing protein